MLYLYLDNLDMNKIQMKQVNHWQLYEAKNKLTQVIKTAKDSGPQFITVRGLEEVVILSIKDYQQMTKGGKSLVDFFQNSPFHETELTLVRSKDLSREVEV